MKKILFILLFIPVFGYSQLLHNGTGNTLLSTKSTVGGASNYVNATGSAAFGFNNIIRPDIRRGQVTNYGFAVGNESKAVKDKEIVYSSGKVVNANKIDLKFDGMAGDKYDILVAVKLIQLSTKFH